MTTNVNNIAGLTTAITQWTNRNDTVFINNIPLFISLAEQEFFIECSTLGNQNYTIGTLTAGNGIIPKPALWGQTLTLIFQDEDENVTIFNRVGYEFIRTYLPNPTAANAPVSPLYYTDLGYDYILMSPTPTISYDFQLVYLTKITPLSPTQPANWITQYAYDALFFSCLHKAYLFLENYTEAEKFQALAMGRYQSIIGYNKERKSDRSADVLKG